MSRRRKCDEANAEPSWLIMRKNDTWKMVCPLDVIFVSIGYSLRKHPFESKFVIFLIHNSLNEVAPYTVRQLLHGIVVNDGHRIAVPLRHRVDCVVPSRVHI